jgi:CheY-like chemotaxis protein
MSPTSGVDILLVEDSPEDAELTLRALARQHLANRVHVVRDGVEALEYLRDNIRPRVVLLDLKLARIAGLEVLRQVKENERTRSLPVVVLTSSRDESDIARAYALGANSYIVKPVDFERFVQVVSEAGLYWLLLNEPPRG